MMFRLETRAAKMHRVNRSSRVSGACTLSRRKSVAPVVIVVLVLAMLLVLSTGSSSAASEIEDSAHSAAPSAIHSIRADGSNRRLLARNYASTGFAVSPNGRDLAFER